MNRQPFVLRLDITPRALIVLTVICSALFAASVAADPPAEFEGDTVISASAMNANFSGLHDRLTALEGYTIGGAIPGADHLVGDEHDTGRTWIDGKPIMRRVVRVFNLPVPETNTANEKGETTLVTCAESACGGGLFASKGKNYGLDLDADELDAIVSMQALLIRTSDIGETQIHPLPVTSPNEPKEWSRMYLYRPVAGEWTLFIQAFHKAWWQEDGNVDINAQLIIEYTKP